MNRYTESALKADMGQVIIALTRDLINPHALMEIMLDPPIVEEDLLDYVERSEVERVLFVAKVISGLVADYSAAHLNALRLQIIAMGVEPEIACDDCGGILLKSCTCEA